MNRPGVGGTHPAQGTIPMVVALLLATLIVGVPAAPTRVRAAADAPSDSSWTNVTGTLAPPAMAGAMMAYSDRDGAFLLFGGWDGEPLGGTWVFRSDTRTWAEVHPAVSPLARGDGDLVYDSRNDVFLLFGGWYEYPNETYIRLGDTWAFSLSNLTWFPRHSASSPSNRSDAAIAYDSADGIVLLFGGFDGVRYLGDAWAYAYENDTWFPRPATPMPSGRADGRLSYDAAYGAFLLFGGNDYSGPNFTFHHLDDTWTYAWGRNEWQQIPTTGGPAARDYAVQAYDPDANVILLTGGYGPGVILDDTWSFDLGTRTWAPLRAAGPAARFAAVGGYDASQHVLVLFGGLGNRGLLNDTWLLTYGTRSPSALPTTLTPAFGWLAGALGGVFLILVVAGAVATRAEARRTSREAEGASPGLQGGTHGPLSRDR